MDSDFSKDLDTLFDNSKNLMGKLTKEKQSLQDIFIDNSVPDEFKEDILGSYNDLDEVIDKISYIYQSLKKYKDVPELVGLLYNEQQDKHLNNILKNLKEMLNKTDMKVICFTLNNVNLEEGLVRGTIVSDSLITESKVSIPKFIFNIGNYTKSYNINKIKKMYMEYGLKVINPVNVFNQSIVFDILSSVSVFKRCTFPSSTISPSIILEYFKNTNKVFLIPEKGFNDNIAIIIEKYIENGEIRFCIRNGSNRKYCSPKNLYENIRKIILNKKYIALKGCETLLWNNYPLEARVYVQKGINGKWGVTKIIGKNDIFTKDPIYGDTIDEVNRILPRIIPGKADIVMKNLKNYSINICLYMEYYFLNIGSCVVDFVIDENGNPFLIFFGGFDQNNYLFELNGKNVWGKYITNSIEYLIYLNKVEKNEGK